MTTPTSLQVFVWKRKHLEYSQRDLHFLVHFEMGMIPYLDVIGGQGLEHEYSPLPAHLLVHDDNWLLNCINGNKFKAMV